MEMIPTPRTLLEQLADFKFGDATNERMQDLMGRNNFGELSEREVQELKAYAELSQDLSILRAQAMLILGRLPE